MTVPVYIHVQDKQPHPRIAIRNWIKELLKANTDLGGRWYASRPNPAFLEELPCGLVYFSDEPADHEKTAPRTYRKDLAIVTEVMHRVDSERENEMDDWLDSRAFEIEGAMLADRFLGMKGLIQDTILTRTQPVTIEDDGDNDIGSIRLFWTITYRADFGDTLKLDEFLKFYNEINGTLGENSVDHVTIREA